MDGTIKRSSDGIPQYAGELELLPMYREEAIQYLMTLESHKRYLAGPRLAKELSGTARVAIRTQLNQDPQWLSHPRDLRAAGFLGVLFGQTYAGGGISLCHVRRKKGESMTSWSACHAEALWEASQALRKVQKEFGTTTTARPWTSSRASSASSWRGSEWMPTSGRGTPTVRSVAEEIYEEENESDPEAGMSGEQAETWPDPAWAGSYGGSGWGGWSWGSWSGWPTEGRYSAWRSQDFEPTWDVSQEIFIPEFLAGFLLLHRASLDAAERANVLAAIRGQFSTETVARALREQWSDDDLARRDRLKMNAANIFSRDRGPGGRRDGGGRRGRGH